MFPFKYCKWSLLFRYISVKITYIFLLNKNSVCILNYWNLILMVILKGGLCLIHRLWFSTCISKNSNSYQMVLNRSLPVSLPFFPHFSIILIMTVQWQQIRTLRSWLRSCMPNYFMPGFYDTSCISYYYKQITFHEELCH